MLLTRANSIRLFTGYLESRNFSSKTISRYLWELNLFFDRLKDIDLKEVNQNDIKRFQEYLHEAKKLKTNTVRFSLTTRRGIMATLFGFFKFLVRNDYILSNPFDRLDLPIKIKHKEIKSLTIDEVNSLLDNIPINQVLDLRDRALFELMYATGLRVSETVNLDITHVDLQDGHLMVRQGKGKKDRVVPLGNNAGSYLKLYMSKSRPKLAKKVVDLKYKDALFLTAKGVRLSVNTTAKVLKKRAKAAGLKTIVNPHMLRHSFATHILEGGAGIKQVKEILGHKSIQTTVNYTHFSADRLKKIMKKYHPRENELYEEFEVSDELKEILKS
jgi:site-specific recombinase XerD